MIRFSDAMLLGDVLKIGSNALILSAPAPAFNNLRVGCAVGGVIVALGLDRVWDYHEGAVWYILQQDYPWLEARHLSEITRLYGRVLDGDMTIQQLVHVVRQWEIVAEFVRAA